MTEPLTRPNGTNSRPDGAGRALKHGIPLGRWAGVRVSAHWSALLTWLLFADLLAAAVLPAARPGQATVAYWLAGAVTALAFFSFLLAHELAHAVTARHYGVGIRSITLWMLGGVSELRTVPGDLRDERRLRELKARRSLVVPPDADLVELARVLPLRGGVAVVVADGHPVGLITGAELARAAQLAGLNWQAPIPRG
ncbi:MAG TPA: hypothetical protein VFU36_16285 [Jatrophihabitans sp.]|nr:hypothetical protein [Jatrophihabitans sp.]